MSSAERINHRVLLVRRPEGNFHEDDFRHEEVPVPELKENEALIRVLYLSLDPAMRIWTSEKASYRPSIPLGSVMDGNGVGIVEESKHPDFAPGDAVMGMMGFQTYAIISSNTGRLAKVPRIPGVPLVASLAVLGPIGATACHGIFEILEPKEGETMVVNAAAGAVGSVVCQIGKILGLRVVGIAGSDSKCEWLRSLGVDATINYLTEDVGEALKAAAPQGVDCIFENVGGEMFDAIIQHANNFARIALCGLISGYNDTAPSGLRDIRTLLSKRIRLQGFICVDSIAKWPGWLRQLGQWIVEGKLQYEVDVVPGLHNAPKALRRLYMPGDRAPGKLVVKVADEDSGFVTDVVEREEERRLREEDGRE